MKRPVPNDSASCPRPSPRSGSALVFAIGCFFFLFVLVLSIYSVGETIRRKNELQNVCDAAAYSAAVVQADALSRMAVLNRAMAWSYIQCTKMQMDYITYKWLAHVRDSFREDMNNISHTGMGEFGKPEMGYYHFGEKGSPFHDNGVKWMSIHFSCHDGVHDNPADSRARYIGLGPNTEGGLNALGTAIGAATGGRVYPADKHWIRINGFSATERRLEYNENTQDLNYVENGKVVQSRLVAALEDAFGRGGVEQLKAINAAKYVVEYCGAMQAILAPSMAEAMTAAAEKTLLENLPHKPDGKIDPELLSDYAWTITPGVSVGNPYAVKADGGYFSPLFNREEDEILFLSMANGLPVDDNRVKLKDWFRSNSEGGSLAAGLDQWFIRADADELKRDKVGVYRNWTNPPKGIQRCYKNANYAEGAASGVLRGNYCLDGDSPRKPQKPSDIGSVIAWSLMHCPQPPSSASRLRRLYFRILWTKGHAKIMREERSFTGQLKLLWKQVWDQVPQYMLDSFAPNAGPSCINHRDRFHDQCANVNDTVGLVAEYEWAAAYWFCFWIESYKWRDAGVFPDVHNVHMPYCVHIPIPSAVFGGRNPRARYGGEAATPFQIAAAQQPMFRPSQDKDARLVGTNLRGWKRSDYRRTFIGADAEPKYGCLFHGGDNNGANMGAKGYVRIYGDDKEIRDDGYVGPVAKPVVLNQRYFNGAGTTIVGVARRQRNVFWWISGKIGKGLGLYDAFSPDIRVRDKDGNEESAGMPNLVAFSAARAAWAPRTGSGVADGADSENNPARGIWGGLWGRHYELRYDTVTDGAEGNFEPRLHPNAPSGETLAKAARLGCVCGQDETGRRLRRQWNLCQTDWDAVLLPVRYAMSVPSRLVDSSASAPVDFDSGDDPDAKTAWSYSDVPGDEDPQFKLFGWNTPGGGSPVAPNMTWRRLYPAGSARPPEPESYGEVVLEPQNMSVPDAYMLFKKRMIH